jgi:hypothetical protein
VNLAHYWGRTPQHRPGGNCTGMGAPRLIGENVETRNDIAADEWHVLPRALGLAHTVYTQQQFERCAKPERVRDRDQRPMDSRFVRTAPILGRRRHSSVVEQLFRKQQVLGSNPSVGSNSRVRGLPDLRLPRAYRCRADRSLVNVARRPLARGPQRARCLGHSTGRWSTVATSRAPVVNRQFPSRR